jgi:hypothetical protein
MVDPLAGYVHDPLLVWPLTYLVVLTLSGKWVNFLLKEAGQDTPDGAEGPGFVIGKLEDVLVLSFVVVDAFTALALVFAAKNLIRKDVDEKHESYYVLGTLANFTWALGIGLLAKLWLG